LFSKQDRCRLIFQTVKTVVTVKMLNSRKQFYGIYHHRNMWNQSF